jgi:hypothetical protein
MPEAARLSLPVSRSILPAWNAGATAGNTRSGIVVM